MWIYFILKFSMQIFQVNLMISNFPLFHKLSQLALWTGLAPAIFLLQSPYRGRYGTQQIWVFIKIKIEKSFELKNLFVYGFLLYVNSLTPNEAQCYKFCYRTAIENPCELDVSCGLEDVHAYAYISQKTGLGKV